MRRALLAAAALLAAVSIVGCSSGSSDPATSDTLRVGTEGTYSPFSYHGTDGNLTGYDVEIAQAVGAKLGKQVEFVQTPWDAIFAGLEADRFDLVANQVTINDERKAKYDLSEPYTVSEGVIVTRADDTSMTQPGRPAGQDHGAVGHQQLGPGRPRRRARTSRPSRASSRPSTLLKDGARRRHRQRHPRGRSSTSGRTTTPASRSPGPPGTPASRRSPPARTAG